MSTATDNTFTGGSDQVQETPQIYENLQSNPVEDNASIDAMRDSNQNENALAAFTAPGKEDCGIYKDGKCIAGGGIGGSTPGVGEGAMTEGGTETRISRGSTATVDVRVASTLGNDTKRVYGGGEIRTDTPTAPTSSPRSEVAMASVGDQPQRPTGTPGGVDEAGDERVQRGRRA